MKRWIWMCLVPLCVGCTTTHMLPVEDQTRVYDADFDTVFDATVEVLEAEGFELASVSYWDGIIETYARLDPESSQQALVTASVSEWDDGVHLFLVYVVTDWRSATFTSEECRPTLCCFPPCNSPCAIYITETTIDEVYSPMFTRAKARQYYDDLFARVEQSL